jgi:MoaA/NifB/PqqE/SkfB family radical SAM enzyme
MKVKKIKLNQIHVTQQIAFGVDSQCTSNPDAFKIFEYCRENGVIPNVTVADISDDTAKKLASLMGAVAVSRYADKNVCYDSVKRLTDLGMKQINIHQLISKETLQQTLETIADISKDTRLAKLNAIVFLSLKKTGRGKEYNTLTQSEFNSIVQICLQKGIRFGFDSCGCASFLEAVKHHPNYKTFEMYAEPCESLRMSCFINVNGMLSPCSFLEEKMTNKIGIDVINCNDFITDVWMNPNSVIFRNKSIECANKMGGCPIYNIRNF